MKKLLLLGCMFLSVQITHGKTASCPRGTAPAAGPLNNRIAGKAACENIEELISEFKKACAAGMWKGCHSMCLLETDANRIQPVEKSCNATLVEVCNMKIDDESCKLLEQRKLGKKK